MSGFKLGDYVQLHEAGLAKLVFNIGKDLAEQYVGIRKVEEYLDPSGQKDLVVYRVSTEKFHLDVSESYFELAIQFESEYI